LTKESGREPEGECESGMKISTHGSSEIYDFQPEGKLCPSTDTYRPVNCRSMGMGACRKESSENMRAMAAYSVQGDGEIIGQLSWTRSPGCVL